MSTGESIISLRSVAKHFGSVRAVDDVSFDIRRGEFFSLLGPSGCGKTTLLRMLAGFEVPTSGAILIDGQDVSTVPPHARPTNMVFQNYAIFPHLSVRENIAYGLRKKGLSKQELAQTVEDALALIKMTGYGDRASHQLSGGQRQRVALARALVCKPKVLLLDEPLGALDKKLREEMQLELRQIQRTVGVTFVFVTHDQEEALALSDRIAVMSRGKALQIDAANRLYEAPNCKEVAAFIGSMNFFQGSLRETSGGTALVDAGPLGQLSASAAENAPGPGSQVSIAVRPEKLRLAWDKPAAGQNAIAGRIATEAYFGDRSHYHVAVEGLAEPIAVAMQKSDRLLDDASSIGRPVWISWAPEAAVLLTE
ncbi:spermidine/putrescine transport system ATP-binding protein/putrescine transport system ATP-binding protein [Dongia mobilis]|uniref:Spermidine/putrescine import ATP-binding protein PotA n=1 Tax=Dongia mobilis TaxID=578943 RepID=A0A4R6WNC9_9PROT|nr:ABC transporter ATP-binding protein [Dongia mobilis]TDQ77649.1 spermidine/putrescine transport system ATP-binding protein/putrescine transport system ATP-binding protein [Dongia mobilis]